MAGGSSHADWIARELESNLIPGIGDRDVSSVVFRSDRPFHPARLDAVCLGLGRVRLGSVKEKNPQMAAREIAPPGPLGGVIRSKGVAWLANCHAYQVRWESAGRSLQLSHSEPWEVCVGRGSHRTGIDGQLLVTLAMWCGVQIGARSWVRRAF